VNARRRLHGERALDELALLGLARRKLAGLELDPGWVQRSSDEGASGDGERMREALLQLAVLEPRLAILDGTDGGLDGEALESLARGVNALRAPERSMLILTRRPDLLERVVPDRVHVLVNGRFVHSGGPELARGLAWTDDGAGAWDGWAAEAAREVHAS
jgi:Fe-S cluster assembly ATP-binding protein